MANPLARPPRNFLTRDSSNGTLNPHHLLRPLLPLLPPHHLVPLALRHPHSSWNGDSDPLPHGYSTKHLVGEIFERVVAT